MAQGSPRIVLLCLAVASAACGSSAPTVDAGSAVDAGPRTDAGSGADSGSDAGASLDAGPGPDSGSATDAGPGLDAGPRLDAGSSTDAGPVLDAGPTIDLGPPMCSAAGGSCLAATCCAGLRCCSGLPLPPGTATCYSGTCPRSDVHLKSDIAGVDADAVLAAVQRLPVATWRYTYDSSETPHIGPMAQDFHAAFGVGENDTTINPIDGQGVALAAIQALAARVDSLQAESRALRQENAGLRARLDALDECR